MRYTTPRRHPKIAFASLKPSPNDLPLTSEPKIAENRGSIGGIHMYSNEDILSVCNFLKQTPEGSLRKMLVDKDLTENHFRVLMKLAKGGPETDFVDAFNKEDMGKLRLSPKEAPMKDTFWAICKKKWVAMGLLNKTTAA